MWDRIESGLWDSGVGAGAMHTKCVGKVNPPWRLVVFDCDGTLVDSQHTIVASMTAAWHVHGLYGPAPDAIRRVIGLPLEVAIARLAPTQRSGQVQSLGDAYRKAFLRLQTQRDYHEPLYPGVHKVLCWLEQAGILMGVATGKGRRGLVATLDRHGLTSRFVTLQTSDRVRGKPDPDMLYQAMDVAGISPSHTVMVGDTVYDMEMAANANVDAVGVSWGYHSSCELSAVGAYAVIDSFDEFIAMFGDISPTALGVS